MDPNYPYEDPGDSGGEDANFFDNPPTSSSFDSTPTNSKDTATGSDSFDWLGAFNKLAGVAKTGNETYQGLTAKEKKAAKKAAASAPAQMAPAPAERTGLTYGLVYHCQTGSPG